MGYSHKGRLGCVDKDDCDKKEIFNLPMEIKDLVGIQITQVIVGNYHSLAISNKGKLYGWGENKCFILGDLSDDEKKRKRSEIVYSPKELKINKNLLV